VVTQQNWEGSGDGPPTEQGREAVLAVLRARGIAVPEGARLRIQAQEDLATLERWLEKAVVASSIEDVLNSPS
jgi:hypothetical protein